MSFISSFISLLHPEEKSEHVLQQAKQLHDHHLSTEDWHPFGLVDNNREQIIRSYWGCLPHQEYRALHILQCENLSAVDHSSIPYHSQQENTHQIWLWYRLHQRPDELRLLFREQFDFAIAEYDAQEIGSEITDFLAYMLQHTESYHQEIFHNENSDKFWRLAVVNRLEQMQKFGLHSTLNA